MDFFGAIKKYWPVPVIIFIVLLGTYVRVFDYRLPYLRNIDSYAFTRQIEDIAANGKLPGHDDLSLAPLGQDRPVGRDLYVYLMAYSFGAIRLVFPDYSLFQFLIWAPAFLGALMAIPMYFIGKILYDRRAGALAAFFIVFDISVLTRTLGGDPDNDGSVLLFPLIAIALFLIAYKYTGQNGFNKKGVLYTLLAGIAMAAWGYVWSGFWFVIWLITGFVIYSFCIKSILKQEKGRPLLMLLTIFLAPIVLIYLLITRKYTAEAKRMLALFAAVMAIFFIFTVPLLGPRVITETIQGPFSFGDIKGEENRPFPNVYVSVAELQSGGGLRDIIQRTNIFFFLLMAFSLVYLAASSLTKRKDNVDTFILLGVWFVGPLIATAIGVRFAILFAAPIAIGSAILISKIFRIIEGEGATD